MTREEAIKYIKAMNDSLDTLSESQLMIALDMAIEALKEPKKGEWKRCKGSFGFPLHECSNCGFCGNQLWHFCPNCGTLMRVKDELNRVSKELKSEIEYKAKVKELESAIAKCEKAEEDFKKRTCKFKSPTNCDFCSFHSDCDEYWKEGDEK